MSEKGEHIIYKLKTYKRLNKDALIFGLPFGVFFIVLAWVMFNLFLIFASPFLMKILFLVLLISGVLFANIIYKKYSIKYISKQIELFFRKVDVVKINENIVIKRKKLTKKN